MRSTKYQMATATTASAVGLGDILIATAGTIYAVVFRVRGTGGAGIGNYSVELTINSGTSSFAETNNPIKGYAVASCTYGFGNAAGYANTFAPIPTGVKIVPGDRLYLNTTQTGTAAASQLLAIDVYVSE